LKNLIISPAIFPYDNFVKWDVKGGSDDTPAGLGDTPSILLIIGLHPMLGYLALSGQRLQRHRQQWIISSAKGIEMNQKLVFGIAESKEWGTKSIKPNAIKEVTNNGRAPTGRHRSASGAAR
jgi:hypothetical protein